MHKYAVIIIIEEALTLRGSGEKWQKSGGRRGEMIEHSHIKFSEIK